MNFSKIKFDEPEPGIGLITLNNPERLNAMSLQMLDELYALFDHLKKLERVRVLVITGEGRGFSSGADLRDERQMEMRDVIYASPANQLMLVQKKYSGIVVEMRRLPQPIIGAINGPAAGGGMSMALACDVIFASPAASFTPSFINIGLSGCELGTSYFLPRLVGSARAAEILLTGRTVDANEAYRIGMISHLAEDGRLMDVAMETARTMLNKSPMGLRLTKEAFTQNLNAPSLESAVELENRNQSICIFTPEFLKAVAEFGKKKSKKSQDL
jgi:enoyl-CoA hydratase